MPLLNLADLPDERVTPKHSTAFGKLATGKHIEIGILDYKTCKGAREHSHPHEQIAIQLSGRSRVTLDGVAMEVVLGQAVHIPPHVRHRVETVEN